MKPGKDSNMRVYFSGVAQDLFLCHIDLAYLFYQKEMTMLMARGWDI